MALGMWRYSCDHPTAFNAGRSGRPHHHLARLSPVRLRTQPLSDDALPARNIALHESAPAVPRRPLPAHAAVLGGEGSRVASGEEGVEDTGAIRESWQHGTGSEEGNGGAARRSFPMFVQ